jgi:hypothetical protein
VALVSNVPLEQQRTPKSQKEASVMSTCAREGCGHRLDAHIDAPDDTSCVDWLLVGHPCRCSAYLAPTPTAVLPESVFPSRAGEDTVPLAPSLGERDADLRAALLDSERALADEKDRADASEERARTAEAEVERLRETRHAVYRELTASRAEVERLTNDLRVTNIQFDDAMVSWREAEALGERIALAIEAHCVEAKHSSIAWRKVNGPVCLYCSDAARIARETT